MRYRLYVERERAEGHTRDRERETHTHTEIHTETHRERETHREGETHRDEKTSSCTELECDISRGRCQDTKLGVKDMFCRKTWSFVSLIVCCTQHTEADLPAVESVAFCSNGGDHQ